MKYFLRYIQDRSSLGASNDDSPLYIFDSNFAKRTKPNSAISYLRKKHNNSSQALCHIVERYAIPKYFRTDFLKLTRSRRPPFRWLVVGPKRSGTGIHIDPLGTSAWNHLIEGRKHWILFPPNTPKDKYKCRTDDEASTWFAEVYPGLKYSSINYVEIVQEAGEIVYVPGGWAHVVMNLLFSIAVTHNFCNSSNLEAVYLKSRTSRPKLASKLRKELTTASGHDMKRKYRKLGRNLRKLDTVPYLEASSESSSSSSSSESDSENEPQICECHNKLMLQGSEVQYIL